jgi:hypothetical protein
VKWFRFYHDAYRNPKVQDLRPELFKFWVNVLCVASESTPRGTIASEAHLRLALGLTKPTTKRWVSELEALALLHRSEHGALRPHDWDKLQPEGDDAGKRKKRQRQGKLRHEHQNGFMENVPGHVAGQIRDIPPRVREEGEREEEGEESSPPPPAPPDLGPEYASLGEWAIQLGDDVSWGRWVLQHGRCGHAAKDIRAAIEEAAGAGKLSQAYVAAKLRGWAAEGGRPKRKGENNGRTAVQQRPEETLAKLKRPDLPRTPEFEAVNRMWDNLERGTPTR